MRKPREEAVLFVTDEDLELIGIKPSTISNKVWGDVVDYLKEYYNEGFTSVLKDAVDHARTLQ